MALKCKTWKRLSLCSLAQYLFFSLSWKPLTASPNISRRMPSCCSSQPLCCWWLSWPILNDAKKLKMTETMTNGCLSESTQRELSNEYQYDRVSMVFKTLCILVHQTKVALALKGLNIMPELKVLLLPSSLSSLLSPIFIEISERWTSQDQVKVFAKGGDHNS